MSGVSWKFDVALLFAGADRAVALAIAEALRKHGLNVFYDEWHQSMIWGNDLSILLPEIYATARFCIPIISRIEGFKVRVTAYIERTQFRREAPWTRSARTARVSI